MAGEQVIVEHEDGRRYSVPREAAKRLYPDFAIVGEETPEAFALVGVPKQKRARQKPRAKDARPAAKPLTSTDAEPG